MTTNAKSRIAIALVALFAVLGLADAPARSAAPALKPYKVGFNAWIGSIAFFVARDKGFFKEEGLDLQAKSFSAPGDGLAPLLTGGLDAAPQHRRQRDHRARQGARSAQGRLPDRHLRGRRRGAGQEGHRRRQGDEGQEGRRHAGPVQPPAAAEGAGEGRADRKGHPARQHEPRRRGRRVRRRQDRRRRHLGAVDHQGLGRQEGSRHLQLQGHAQPDPRRAGDQHARPRRRSRPRRARFSRRSTAATSSCRRARTKRWRSRPRRSSRSPTRSRRCCPR